MEIIDKPTANMLAELLHAYGVRRVVVSPGSRCAPLSLTLARDKAFQLNVVIDERSAAFVALGMALRSGEPVAMVCTSGSALLDYAPALSEAYYRRVPLIAISADRPADRIDQRDSQTIRQAGAVDAVVRRSVDIADVRDARALKYAGRLINEALAAAVDSHIPGPVHINMQFDEPLTPVCDRLALDAKKYDVVRPHATYDFSGILASIEPDAGILVVAGDMHPSAELTEALRRGAGKAFAVFSEAQSNIPGVRCVDFTDAPVPDIVISIGGALVDARLKKWLRSLPCLRHISLGYDDNFVDTFGHLSERVECPPADFLNALSHHISAPGNTFAADFGKCVVKGEPLPVVRWLSVLADACQGADFHFSNGSAIRYAQCMNLQAHRVDCNRGVSGIDGCTSTAIGAAMAADGLTVLVTGDMSAAYDVGALAIAGIPDTFRMLVLDNGGGDIFRAISTTSGFEECERLFAVPPQLPLEALARAYGFDYYECTPTDAVPDAFCASESRKSILRLKLEPGDACILFSSH